MHRQLLSMAKLVHWEGYNDDVSSEYIRDAGVDLRGAGSDVGSADEDVHARTYGVTDSDSEDMCGRSAYTQYLLCRTTYPEGRQMKCVRVFMSNVLMEDDLDLACLVLERKQLVPGPKLLDVAVIVTTWTQWIVMKSEGGGVALMQPLNTTAGAGWQL